MAVAQAIPTYATSYFRLEDWLCLLEFNGKSALVESTSSTQDTTLVKQNKCAHDIQTERGMDFIYLNTFNVANLVHKN